LIEISQVTHAFGDRVVLRNVDLAITEPRIAVIGANGSGKSTFARLLNGLVIPEIGVVRVDGLDTRSDAAEVRRRVGFVFTDPDAQIVMPTVAEDVAFGLRRHKLDKAEVARVVGKALESYGLADHADHPAHLLSGGQKQMLALCSVLVTDPKIVVFDEPTTLLDLRNTQQVQEVIQRLDQRVVMVTHDLKALDGFNRVLVFDDGAVVFDGVPNDAVDFYRELVR
jgi:biotin transport system ATP-binding protein